LLARGAVTAAELSSARKVQRSLSRPLEDILLAQGIFTETDRLSALAQFHGLGLSNLSTERPDPTLACLVPASQAIAFEAVPWRRVGGDIVVATSQPAHLTSLRDAFPEQCKIIVTLASRAQVLKAQVDLYGAELARRAEGLTPAQISCRAWNPARAARVITVALAAFALTVAIAPTLAVSVLFAIVSLVFLSNMALKVLAFATASRAAAQQRPMANDEGQTPPPAMLRLPVVTILIPLFDEQEIASTLITNLARLDYPAERLDIILITEASDTTTNTALTACKLPPMVRSITVPAGQPQTKPRALNFALNFARGSIIGIYDAEDRPEPDQITKVVSRFAELPPEVACLQGRLDYYNASHNALARCFAIEYASWFRVILPGVQRLGLFMPLGGTTLFLRREVLTRVGAWDAHNVTEDAELGLRLARHGYRTEMVETTTFEEANAAILPWIKQRSRWQKGYLMTWAAGMRHPRRLLQELGPLRFLGFQVQVLCAVAGFLVAPVLWSLMVKPFGYSHPFDAILGPVHYAVIGVIMVASLTLSIALAFAATRAAHLRHVRPWIPLVELYHVLGTLAAWRALSEMLFRPFFWAKTQHGRFGGTEPAECKKAQPCASASSLRRTTNAMDK